MYALATEKVKGRRVWQTEKVLVFPGPRTSESLSSDDMGKLVALAQSLLDRYDGPNKPAILSLCIAEDKTGGSPEEILQRAKRAILQSLAEYLFPLEDARGMHEVSGYLAFATAFPAFYEQPAAHPPQPAGAASTNKPDMARPSSPPPLDDLDRLLAARDGARSGVALMTPWACISTPISTNHLRSPLLR